MSCLDSYQMIAFHSGGLSPDEKKAIAIHLDSCARCSKKSNAYHTLTQLMKSNQTLSWPQNGNNCLDDEHLLSYLEGRLQRKEIAMHQNHIAECESCLGRLKEYDLLLHELRQEGILSEHQRCSCETEGRYQNNS